MSVTEHYSSIQLNNLVDQRCRIEILRERSAIGSTDFHQQLWHLVVFAVHGEPPRWFRDQKSGDNGPTITHTNLGYANFGVYLCRTWQTDSEQLVWINILKASKNNISKQKKITSLAWIHRETKSIWCPDAIITNPATSVAPSFYLSSLLNTVSIASNCVFKLRLAEANSACGYLQNSKNVISGAEHHCRLAALTLYWRYSFISVIRLLTSQTSM